MRLKIRVISHWLPYSILLNDNWTLIQLARITGFYPVGSAFESRASNQIIVDWLRGVMKECRGCKQTKPLADFSAHAGFKDGRNSKCKLCKELLRKEAVAAGRQRSHTPYSYKKQLKSRYGLTQEQYEVMLEECRGRCQICGESKSLNVDHCHTTGVVRGLLCTACNTGLGKLGDSVERLQLAIEYLDGKPARLQEPPAKRTA